MECHIKQVKPLWLLIIGIVVAVGCVWQATRLTYQVELENMVKIGEERLTLYASTLHEALSRYASLPYVLAHNTDVQQLLDHGVGSERVNRYLENLNREAGSEALYVMAATGVTAASSNWQEPVTYIGQNYGYRPYFTAAKAGRVGGFFAIGVTTGRPGYFMSYPVHGQGRFLGAAVVKVNLDSLQEDWRKGGETVLVSDANGVLFLSSNNDWKYNTLDPLTEDQRRNISAGRQYGSQPLKQLPLLTLATLDTGHRIVRAGNTHYLMLSRPLKDLGWTLLHLAPLRPATQHSQAVATIGIASALLIISLGMYIRERRQKQLSRRKAKEAEAIKEINLRLQEEIEEHCRTEQALRDTQAELVQSSKLAALGQMAAGIVHELNQPISAIRTHAASGRLLLDRDRPEQLSETLAAMSRITEHMASITAQLKSFASKTPVKSEKIVFQNCLETALGIVKSLLEESNVNLQKQLPEKPLYLNGSCGQIEQVLVNLIRNGVDAIQNSSEKIIRIELGSTAQQLELQISDTGTGIPEENLDELFNPFFTTKEAGQGLGLGLSICYRIINDLGGSISVANNSKSGAVFTVRLPLLSERTDIDDD